MEQFLQDCIREAFSSENLNTIWENRTSNQDIIGLNTDLPLRYKLNAKGTRNVELMMQSQYGFYYRTIALVEDTDILFPRAFDRLTNGTKFNGFIKYGLKAEINVMMGAFSMESLSNAIRQTDVGLYKSNDAEFEMVKAFDGTMQTFVKEKSGGLMDFSFDDQLYSSSLDGVAVSAFKFEEGTQIFPTKNSHNWLEKLVPQRLLEVFTIERN
jgi:hypothetical protein|tara:strand:- start:986 stop:1621 length:636 start_codon:yes stop_codon:yes gene_type:complete